MEYLLQHLLMNSSRENPSKQAVSMGEQSISYGELDILSNQLAASILGTGVQKGDRVGIYLQKSIATIVSVFAIMKAGGIYVPLDPKAPARRLAYITQDCGIELLLTSCELLSSLSALVSAGSPLKNVILTDDGSAEIIDESVGVMVVSWSTVVNARLGALEPPDIIDTDLAYILYTSGSTGEPKGVMIAHRTIFTFINWAVEEFRLTPEDRVTSNAPLHFDLSTFDIYVTIKAGGTIVLVPEDLCSLPMQLAEFLARERISVTYLVPSILAFMASYGKLQARNFDALRLILFAGEVFPMKHLRKLTSAIPHAEYYNLYGPTETNVCTYYRVRPEDTLPERTNPVPIGQACANVEVFAINDSGLVVTEPGQEGELWVRGSCVAQGYWGDTAKTARSFGQSPRSPLYTDIVYRTGDIVTMSPNLRDWIYVGRRDHMIKSRGYRIELGEIENALHQHERVREAAVSAYPDGILGNRLIAFVVTTDDRPIETRELVAFCAQRIPQYMIPEAFNICEVLPKTSSGKLDRLSLGVMNPE